MKELLWADRKRIFGMPISFTRYYLYDDRLVHSNGFLFINEGEILLYRIMDIQVKYSIIDRILGVGSIVLFGADVSDSRFEIKKIKNPREVHEYLNELIDNERIRLGLKGKEIFGAMHASNGMH